MEILKGTVLEKYLEKVGLGFMKAINCQILQGIGGMAHMLLNCDFLPIFVRPFVSGIFWLLSALAFLNYQIIVGFGGGHTDSTKLAEIDETGTAA